MGSLQSVLGNGFLQADYWKSQARKHCDFCKCWIADNKPSVEFHEGGRKHKENVAKRLKEIHRNSAKQAKQQQKFENDIDKMEKAAMAAYLKDVENNTRDMTSDKIVQEKWNKTEASKRSVIALPESMESDGKFRNPNSMPDAAPEAHPRFKESHYSYGVADIDPCDPYAKQKLERLEARKKAKAAKEAAKKEKSEGKGKSEKGKGKRKKSQVEPSGSKMPVRKVWYEARAQGYSYYWNIETNQSVWEPPAEGFMSIAEQEEEAKEQALQQQLMAQLEQEEAKEKADIFEERRANAEREKLKEIRKRFYESKKAEKKEESSGGAKEDEEEESEEEKIPYRRDYSVPQKPQPYGSWQVVKTIPDAKASMVPMVPSISFSEPPPPQREFKEKIITHIFTGDSDDEGPTVSFKKRKFGNKNVRKRLTDD